MNLSLIPGGPEAFELAAKFCYGINIEITLSNVAMLRCAAHFLEMTEEFVQKNLEARTEAYLKDTVLPNISNSISVLHRCECLSLKLDHNFPMKTMPNIEPETPSDWWGKSLSVLNLEFFQRVLTAVKSKGLKQDMISKILINYTHNSLQGLVIRDPHIVRGSLLDMELQKKQRVIVEAMVSLLPTQSRRSSVPMAFLSSLLKTAIASSASTSCRSDLERRIGLQLAEIALDTNLLPSKFIALAELLPDHARIISDGLYRAVDIFLKVIVSQESTKKSTISID